MINTCYEIGHLIDRESLFKIFINKYNLNSIYDSEGYPGVRLEYYYNKNTTNTINEGKCICSETCKGKGSGEGDKNCRKISVAIFQSGSAIIAGGCKNAEPIYCAYHFINNILKNVLNDVVKTEISGKKVKKKSAINRYIEIDKLINLEQYKKLLQKESCNISLKISIT